MTGVQTCALPISLSGTGPNNASDAAQKLISHGADRLISWGCAGALSTQLKPGHLIIATQLIDQNNNSINQTHATLTSELTE